MATQIPDPYGRSTFHGRPLDNATIAALKIAEERLGYELTILQGIGGATASAGTHLEGRAVDLSRWDDEHKVPVLKRLGFAVWPRDDLPGVWGEHIHAILIFESRTNTRGLAPSGFRQIDLYDRGLDGLADMARDPNPWRPSPPAVFTLEEYRATFAEATKPKTPTPTPVTKARDKLVEAIHAAGHAAALLEDTDPSRAKARSQVDELRGARRDLKAALEALPAR